MKKNVILEQKTVEALLLDPRVLGLSPTLSAAAAKLKTAKTAKCSKCARNRKLKDATAAAKRAVATMSPAALAQLKQILQTENITIVLPGSKGTPRKHVV